MAKVFNKVYLAAKETAYAKLDNILILLGAMNSTANFNPVLKPGQVVGAGDVEYLIQRAKRIKAKAQTGAHSPGTTTTELALLDSMSTVEWDSVAAGTGSLKSVGVKIGINEKFDADSLGAIHTKAISDMWDVRAEERIEFAINELATGLTPTAISLTGTTKFRRTFSQAAKKIQLIVDDFKHMSKQQIIFINPVLTDYIEEEMGETFYNEVPIYGTTLSSRYSIAGHPVVELPSLNKFQGSDANHRFAAIVMDVEAFAFKGDGFQQTIDQKLGATRFYGEIFYEVMKRIDDTRVSVFEVLDSEITAVGSKSKKVSA